MNGDNNRKINKQIRLDHYKMQFLDEYLCSYKYFNILVKNEHTIGLIIIIKHCKFFFACILEKSITKIILLKPRGRSHLNGAKYYKNIVHEVTRLSSKTYILVFLLAFHAIILFKFLSGEIFI